MAILSRPGVEITQVLTPSAPTVRTPALVPCIVGPCFQIVEPLANGAINPAAAVIVSARLAAPIAAPGPLDLSGTVLRIKVNGSLQTVSFPAVAAGQMFSQAQAVNVLNGQLVGATAAFDTGGKLIITTAVKGGAASLEVDGTDGLNTAAIALGFNDGGAPAAGVLAKALGRSTYTGFSISLPFNNLPSPKANVNEVTFLPEELKMYRTYDGVPYEFSTSKATNWTSIIPSSNATDAGLTQSTTQWRRQALVAVAKASGSKTDTIQHLGTQASLRLPLQHSRSADATTCWPDPTGRNYLEVVCPGGVNGKYIGSAGNNVTVKFDVNGDLAPGAVQIDWQTNNDRLLIQHNNGTYAGIQYALQTAGIGSNDSDAISVSLVYAEAGTTQALSGIADHSTFKLAGGEDPAKFAEDPASNLLSAIVRGSVLVESTTTANDLGISNMSLEVSVDGGDWQRVTFAGTTAVNATLAGLSGVAVTYPDVDANDGVLVSVLQLRTLSALGTDSTLELRAEPKVLEALFDGFTSKTEVLSGAALYDGSWGGGGGEKRKLHLEPGYNYNVRAASAMERAVVPGSLRLSFAGLTVAGFHAAPLSGTLSSAAHKLQLSHSERVGVDELALTVDSYTPAELADEIAAQIVAEGWEDYYGVRLIAANGQNILVISDTSGVDGATVGIDSSTSSALKTYLLAAGFQVNTDATTSVAGRLVVADTVNTGAAVWNVLEAPDFSGAQIAAGVTNNLAFAKALLLEPDAGFLYSQGVSGDDATSQDGLTFTGSLGVTDVEDRLPLVVSLNSNTSLQLQYQRGWKNALAGVAGISPVYQGKVFHGRPKKVRVGDFVYNGGVTLGRVSAINSATYRQGGDFNAFSNTLVLSDPEAVAKNARLVDWYIVANELTGAGTDPVAPELQVNPIDQSLTIKHALNRGLDGLAVSGLSAPMYTGYRALRKDVSAASANPALLQFAGISEVEIVIGPIDTRNPLAFGLYCAFLNTTNIAVAALGVDDVTADAPDGTVDAYTRALEYLETREVYALAPLSQDPGVHQKVSAHIEAMSSPSGRLERIAFVNQALPTEKVPLLIASGIATIEDGATASQKVLTFSDPTLNLLTAFSGKRDASGATLNPSAGFTPANGVYLDREGDPYRYLVVAVPSINQLVIETDNVYGPGAGPGSSGNQDGFYRTQLPAGFEVDGEVCALHVRQAALDSTTTGGKLAICSTLAEIAGGATGYQNRRLYFIQPERVGIEIGGVSQLVPGYYICAADAARVGQQNPAQPFTNLPYVGFNLVVGSSDKFSENQMATAAAGGVWWVVQDTPGGALACRHQLSTDVSTIETRELSITKSVDFAAKVMRANAKAFIGRNNITQQLLELLGLNLGSVIVSISGLAIAGGSIEAIEQDQNNPDTVAVSAGVDVFYPCNRIKITILV